MPRPLFQSTPSKPSAMPASELAVAGRERGNGSVAILLAVAAVVAAIVGTRASMVSSDASDAWQSSLRTTEKRAASVMNSVQTLYQGELPMAIQILQAQILAAELKAAAPGQSPGIEQALNVEGDTQAQVAENLSAPDLAKPVYALPSGGFDLGKRMADLRASSGLTNLDPDSLTAKGDRLAHKAVLLGIALLPTSLGALLGVLAQPLRRYRTILLGGGAAAVVAGAVLALAVEVLA